MLLVNFPSVRNNGLDNKRPELHSWHWYKVSRDLGLCLDSKVAVVSPEFHTSANVWLLVCNHRESSMDMPSQIAELKSNTEERVRLQLLRLR